MKNVWDKEADEVKGGNLSKKESKLDSSKKAIVTEEHLDD